MIADYANVLESLVYLDNLESETKGHQQPSQRVLLNREREKGDDHNVHIFPDVNNTVQIILGSEIKSFRIIRKDDSLNCECFYSNHRLQCKARTLCEARAGIKNRIVIIYCSKILTGISFPFMCIYIKFN